MSKKMKAKEQTTNIYNLSEGTKVLLYVGTSYSYETTLSKVSDKFVIWFLEDVQKSYKNKLKIGRTSLRIFNKEIAAGKYKVL